MIKNVKKPETKENKDINFPCICIYEDRMSMLIVVDNVIREMNLKESDSGYVYAVGYTTLEEFLSFHPTAKFYDFDIIMHV